MQIIERSSLKLIIGWTVSILISLPLSQIFAEQSDQAEPAREQPCSAQEHEQFSFWLGRWDSFDKQGKKQGTNQIQKIMGGCALQENWHSQRFKGTSYSFYNKSTDQWHQTWVDNSGGNLILKGGLRGGNMQMSAVRTNESGEDIIDRITWSPLEDGRVRQHWQSSADTGVSWTDVFDGYYVKQDQK